MTAQDKALKENTASAPLQIVAPGTCVETGEQATLVLGMYDHLVETIHQYNPSADFAQIDKAFRYADTHHNGQLRKDGSPFITHPLAVAQIIAEELRLDSESIEAALMHDCIEDTSATYAEIAKEFSPAVADLVEGVSKLTRVQYASKEEEQMENLRKMLMAMAKDIRVILIKLADRTHNMRTMEYQTAEKQRQKSLETMEIYAPIAHRLGMQRIKWELEDLSLKVLDPIGYNEIVEGLKAQSEQHEEFLQGIQDRIKELCPDSNILEVVDIGKDVVGAGTTYTETMIQKYPELNCILAYGDAAATEAVEAVKAAGMNSDDFGIFACDGTESAIKYIADNDVMRGTLMFNSMAEMVRTALYQYLDGELEKGAVVDYSITPITVANVADYVK